MHGIGIMVNTNINLRGYKILLTTGALVVFLFLKPIPFLFDY